MKTTMLHFVRLVHSAVKSSVFYHDGSIRSQPGKPLVPSTAHLSELHGEALVVAANIHGKILRLSDLTNVFRSWPTAENKHLAELEVLVNSLLEGAISNKRKLEALKQADFPRLMSLWYPDAEWPELKIATIYTVWIFVWDDEIDTGDTEAAVDEKLAQAYYRESLSYVHRVLGLSDRGHEIDAPHQNMKLFEEVGRAMRAATDIQQRQRFFDELENFMLQVGIEHEHRRAGTIPTTDEYISIRAGSVGCAPQIAMTEYILKFRLPETVMNCKAMKALWKETVQICLILNDVYSAQKEIKQGSLLNLVPVMFKNVECEGQESLDAVSKDLDLVLKEAMEGFEGAASDLGEVARGDAQLQSNLISYIKWCRYFITGVLHWSLGSSRYGMAKCINADGSLSILL
ncbi:terpenoid synthase [Nemania sp. FL0916]|nr:terpenoid synthase [Nemania sp. FL0916]